MQSNSHTPRASRAPPERGKRSKSLRDLLKWHCLSVLLYSIVRHRKKMEVMYKRVLIVMFQFVTLHSFAGTETLSYDISVFNTTVGKMVITHDKQADGTDLYTLVTSSKAKFLWLNKTNDSRYQLVYKAGRLLSSTFKEIENGELKRWCNIKWDGAKYQVDGYKGKRTFTDDISVSTITAYFDGSKKINRIFYESEGDFANIEYPEPNTMEFKTSDGHKSIYHYVNNKVNNTEFKLSFATVYMTLSK
jgi:hypothetical protein